MNIIFAASFIIVLYVFGRSLDIAISSARANDVIRAIFYGLVALLAIIYLILQFIH